MVCKYLTPTEHYMCSGVLKCRMDCQIWDQENIKEFDMCPKHKFEITPECWEVENGL